MNTYVFVLNILLLVLGLIVLFYFQKKYVSFNKRTLSGLFLGIIIGVIIHYVSPPEVITKSLNIYRLVSEPYIILLKSAVFPLILVSILSAMIKMEKSESLLKYASLTIGILLVTVAIATVIGISVSYIFNIGSLDLKNLNSFSNNLSLNQHLSHMPTSLVDTIISFFPVNPFFDLTGARDTSTIATVFFAIILGSAYLGVKRKQPEKAIVFANFVESMYAIIMRVITIVLRLTPYGLMALIAQLVANSNISNILALINFTVATYVAMLIMFVIHLLIVSFFGFNPITFVKKLFPVLIFGATTRSSAAALPMAVEIQTEKMGVPTGIANLASSFGLSIGQNACGGIYPVMVLFMTASLTGIDPFTFSFIIRAVLIVIISSFGVSGVGGGAIYAALIVLATFNLPVHIMGILIAIDPIIDMGRTALNINGFSVSSLVTSKILGENNKEVYDSDVSNLENKEL